MHGYAEYSWEERRKELSKRKAEMCLNLAGGKNVMRLSCI